MKEFLSLINDKSFNDLIYAYSTEDEAFLYFLEASKILYDNKLAFNVTHDRINYNEKRIYFVSKSKLDRFLLGRYNYKLIVK